jgi:lambda repressor-like predicted transcriptional regulator
MHHEGKRGTKDVCNKRPLYVRKKRRAAIGFRGWNLRQLSPPGRNGPAYKTLKETLEMEFMKRAPGMFSGSREMTDWTVWRDRCPPERENKDWTLWS